MGQDSPSTAKKTGGQPSKLVDLGAAATFAQQSASTQKQAPSAQQGLFGDFQQSQTTSTSNTSGAGGFADFEAAFQGPSEETQSAGELGT